jgi:trk system potassium uptake protein TrkA
LGIDLIINPERVTAQVISKLIQVPEAINVEYYANGKVQLLELVIKEDSPVINKRLNEINFPKPNLIVAILRDERMIIPRGTDYIRPGDFVFIIAETKNMLAVEKVLGKKRTKVENVVILGGGRIGYHLAKLLEKKPINVKVIDKNIEVCQEISSDLEDTLVLNGDGTDLSLLEEEDVANTDMFVSVTNDDKVNLLVSLLAKHIGAKKTAAQVRRSDYIPLVEKVGIDVAVSPRTLTAGAILQFIRKGDIVSVTLLGSVKAEMLELMVSDNKKIINKPLKNLRFPKDAILGAIVRDNNVIVPTGDDFITKNDRVMVFALPEAIKRVEKFFSPS